MGEGNSRTSSFPSGAEPAVLTIATPGATTCTTASSLSPTAGMPGRLEPSARGQYEITDVNNAYIARGELEHDVIDFGWSDAGTPESLFRATVMMHESGFWPL